MPSLDTGFTVMFLLDNLSQSFEIYPLILLFFAPKKQHLFISREALSNSQLCLFEILYKRAKFTPLYASQSHDGVSEIFVVATKG